MSFKKTIVLLLSILLFACVYPTESVQQGAERPTLVIRGASASSMLYVDDLGLGKANQYNGKPNKLLIETGRHNIKIMDNGAVIYTEDIFVSGGELKTISIGN